METITDYKEIKTVESAFEVAGADFKIMPGTEGLLEEFKRPMELIYQALVTAKAIRMGFKPNYNDVSQPKYNTVHDLEEWSANPSGFRFLRSYRTVTRTFSVLGPLLCQPTTEQDAHYAKVAESVLRELMKGE